MKNIYLSLMVLLTTSWTFCSAQLTGTLTAGNASTDYPTLTAAIAALQTSGVGAGGVTINIVPGTYQENIVVGGITGISQTSPLNIIATPGTVTFQGTGTTATTNAVIQVNALSFVTIDGLNIVDISTPGQDVEFGIRFNGTATVGCRNNTIRNCNITLGPGGARPSTATRGVFFGSVANNPAATNNDNVIDNVKVDNSSWGIEFRCAADFFGRITNPDFNNAVINCTFGETLPLGHDLSSGSIGINALGGRNMLIENNTVVAISNLNAAPTLPITTTGISLDSCSGIVRNNIIDNIEYQGTIGSVFGIRSSTFLGDETLISNNVITNLKRSNFNFSTTDPSLTITGIWIFSQNGNNGLAKVLHNSIYLTSDVAVGYSSGAINLSGGSTGNFPAEIFNNIAVNNISTNSASYRSFALVDGNTTRGALRSNNNILFANGANGYLGAIGRELGGNEQFTNDLTVFQTLSATNQSSANFLPQFANPASGNLSFSNGVTNPNNYLVPTLIDVPTDVISTTRFSPSTFAGAYESSVPLSVTDLRTFQVTMYPNPVQNELHISSASNGTLDTIDIYNLLGVQVASLKIDNPVQNVTIPVANFASGLYIAQITGSEGIAIAKFTKN